MPKLSDMTDVWGGEEGFPVELWRDDVSGRLVAVAYDEAGYNSVEFDLADIIDWLRFSEGRQLLLANEAAAVSLQNDIQGHSGRH